MELITKYINKLGFNKDFKLQTTDFGVLFLYETLLFNQITKKNTIIPFLFFEDTKDLFEYHLIEWNKNELDYFVAIENDKSYIIKAKEKPDNNAPLKKEVLIDSFNYGINTQGYEDILSIPFSKENLNNSVFFEFVLQKQKEIKSEVDVHLLNNLIVLKIELSKIDKNTENINSLILKCLFIKYLEDRSILPNLSFVKILQKRNPKLLQDTFFAISIINGDILKKELIITEEHIEQLEYFFTHDYKEFIKTKQQNLFYPYQFNNIPIQLISNIYEEFLGTTNKEEKKTKGIFYTRTFVVDFMLSHEVYDKIDKKENVTILDPACGSGAFLVQAFKRILSNPRNKELSIDEKANLLKKQIFGIDIDENALQITALSLYLTLLQGIDKEAIKKQIEIKNPILPSLIGSNLLKKNTITENIEFDFVINLTGEHIKLSKFDCIVANPPWALVNNTTDNSKEIKEQHRKSEIYKSIHNRYLQLSQFFLLKILKLCHQNTSLSIIVNTSIFYNFFSSNFRIDFLNKFSLKYYYELSDLKKILFRTRGKGANEPAAVLIFDLNFSDGDEIKYIVPKLTKFNELLRTISYCNKDIKILKQSDLSNEEILWRIFINGNWKDYQLIKKIELKKDETIEIKCEQGIQAQTEPSFMVTNEAIECLTKTTNDLDDYYNLNGKIYHKHNDLKKAFIQIAAKNNITIDYKTFLKIKSLCKKEIIDFEPKLERQYFDKDNFNRYSFGLDLEFLTTIEKKINWNNNIKRKRSESLYKGDRFLILRQPNENDGLRLKVLHTNQDFVFADKIIGLKLKNVKKYDIYFAILSSKLAGYFLSNISCQWNKGRRDTLLNDDLQKISFPVINFNNPLVQQIEDYVLQIQKLRKLEKNIDIIENKIDELIFELYGLLEFEKEIIREFYQINVEKKNKLVDRTEIQSYVDKFREVYQLVMKDNLRLNASSVISTNIGTAVKFDVVYDNEFKNEVKFNDFDSRKVLQLVKEKQIQQEMLSGFINEDKVKIYNEKSFYIVKSNQFKDWTKRQAMEDANEEVQAILKKLF